MGVFSSVVVTGCSFWSVCFSLAGGEVRTKAVRVSVAVSQILCFAKNLHHALKICLDGVCLKQRIWEL